MTPIRSFLSWIFGKLWSVVVVFAILWLGAFVVARFQELKQLDQTVVELRSIEAEVKSAAARASAEAQARITELDQAAQEAVAGRVQTLNEEIARLSGQLPSAPQRAMAIAKGDTTTISGWARNEVAIRAKQEERDVLARILDHRHRIGEYKRWMRDGPAELERIRLEHVADLEEIARLDKTIDQLARDHPVLVNVPLTQQRAKLQRLRTDREAKTEHTHALKAKHDQLSTFLRALEAPSHPGTLLQEVKTGPVLDEVRSALSGLEAKLGEDWLWSAINLKFSTVDLLKAAVIIVGVAAATPFGIRLAFFYILAPIATRRPAVALLPDSGGLVLTANDSRDQAAANSTVSCGVRIDSSNELLIHPEYRQSLPNASENRTVWILNRQIPLSSIAAGLCALTRVRAETPQTVVVSSTRDPLSEVSLITIPEASSVVLLPRHIVGVVQARGEPPRITPHWRLFSLHAWLTLQLRYLVFHGPVTLVIKGCRGVRVEEAEAGRSLSAAATIGFSANLRYASRRCETLFAYLSGRQPLLNDSFAGGSGYYIYQEMPYRRRGGALGRGLEGLLDAALKPLGI